MGAMLAELGKKLAERWMSLLVLPGVLYLAVSAAARALGHAHPFDLDRLTEQISEWAGAPAVRTVGGQVVLLAAVLVASAVVGLIATALGSLAEQLHLATNWYTWPPGIRHLARRVTRSRVDRWKAAAETWHRLRDEAADARLRRERVDPLPRYAAQVAMTRISVECPERPTWSGDRIQAVAVRLERDYHLDLSSVWPHLWMVLPDTVRADITTARQTLTRATALTAWAVLYLCLAVWWWPATAVTAALALASWRRTRAAADVYAHLLEAAARTYIRALAEHLSLDPVPLTQEFGDTVTLHLTPSPPPRPRNDPPAAGA
ncbi:hypothetical protein ABT147_44115 [Streptomyces sp. NPDC001868]|uniref:hypothetical protein n=1 Tax=Streptomyces sp. NPDC001868 TaxID=3154401 RepID=UPI00332CAEF0